MTVQDNTEPTPKVKPKKPKRRVGVFPDTPPQTLDFDAIRLAGGNNIDKLLAKLGIDFSIMGNGDYSFWLKGKERFWNTKTRQGRKGNSIIDLYMLHFGSDTKPAAKKAQEHLDDLAAKSQLDVITEEQQRIFDETVAARREAQRKKAFRFWQHAATDIDRAYLINRNIDPSVIDDNVRMKSSTRGNELLFKLSKAPGSEPEGLVVFELDKSNKRRRKINCGVSSENGVWFGEPGELLGICEGPVDALSLRSAGIGFVVATGGANRLHTLSLPEMVKEVIIFADRGPDGEKYAAMAKEAYSNLLPDKVSVIEPRKLIVEGGKYSDWNDDLRINGAQNLKVWLKTTAKRNTSSANPNVLTPSEALTFMNERHAVVTVGDKTQIISDKYNPHTQGTEMIFQNERDITLLYSNLFVKVLVGDDNKNIPIAKWWLTNFNRRSYNTIFFDPAKPKVYNECLNLWDGLAVEPKQCNIQRLLDFIYEIACDKQDAVYEDLLNLFALGVQKPGELWGTAIIFHSPEEGTGKGVLANMYGALFGKHAIFINDGEYIDGEFSGHLKNKCLAVCDEVALNKKDKVPKVGSMVTDPVSIIHTKNRTPENDINRLKFIFMTNSRHAILASPTARRWLCIRYSTKQMQKEEFFTPLKDWYDKEGGKEGFLHYLLNRDISKFNKYKITKTDMLRENQDESRPAEEKVVLHMLTEMILPDSLDGRKDETRTIRDIRQTFTDDFPGLKYTSGNRISDALKKIGCKKRQINGKSYWQFLDWETMRKNWSKAMVDTHRVWPTIDAETNEERPARGY